MTLRFLPAESPNGNSKADKGSTVTLTVSKGRGDVSVPSVQGEDQARAKAALMKAGLKIDRIIPTPSSRFTIAASFKRTQRWSLSTLSVKPFKLRAGLISSSDNSL